MVTFIYVVLVIFTSWTWNWVAFIVALFLDSAFGSTKQFTRNGQDFTKEDYYDEFGIEPEDDPNLEN